MGLFIGFVTFTFSESQGYSCGDSATSYYLQQEGYGRVGLPFFNTGCEPHSQQYDLRQLV